MEDAAIVVATRAGNSFDGDQCCPNLQTVDVLLAGSLPPKRDRCLPPPVVHRDLLPRVDARANQGAGCNAHITSGVLAPCRKAKHKTNVVWPPTPCPSFGHVAGVRRHLGEQVGGVAENHLFHSWRAREEPPLANKEPIWKAVAGTDQELPHRLRRQAFS